MTAVIHKISVGPGGNTLSPQESLHRSVSFEETALTIDRARVRVPLQRRRQ